MQKDRIYRLTSLVLITILLWGCGQSVYVYGGKDSDSDSTTTYVEEGQDPYTTETTTSSSPAQDPYAGASTTSSITASSATPSSTTNSPTSSAPVSTTAAPRPKPSVQPAPPPASRVSSTFSSQDKNMILSRLRGAVLPGWSVIPVDQVRDLAGDVKMLPPARFILKEGHQHFCSLLVYPQQFRNAVVDTTTHRTPQVEYLGQDGRLAFFCHPQYKGKTDPIIYLKRILKLH